MFSTHIEAPNTVSDYVTN